jgi:hypothetical protein
MHQLLKKPLRERPWNYEMSLGSTWDGTIAGKVTSASEARARIQAAQIIATGPEVPIHSRFSSPIFFTKLRPL